MKKSEHHKLNQFREVVSGCHRSVISATETLQEGLDIGGPVKGALKESLKSILEVQIDVSKQFIKYLKNHD